MKSAWLPLLLCLLTAAYLEPAAAETPDSPLGLWVAVDDAGGRPKGLMRIYQQGDTFFGRSELIPGTVDPALRCTHCKDESKDQLMAGLLIMRNMRFNKGEYSGGDILDPGTWRVYGCKFHLTDGGRRMVLRGFFGIALLGGTQVWRRVP